MKTAIRESGGLVKLVPALPAATPGRDGSGHGIDLHAVADGPAPILARKSGNGSRIRFLSQIGHIPGGYPALSKMHDWMTLRALWAVRRAR
jgi:hypothetical protein